MIEREITGNIFNEGGNRSRRVKINKDMNEKESALMESRVLPCGKVVSPSYFLGKAIQLHVKVCKICTPENACDSILNQVKVSAKNHMNHKYISLYSLYIKPD